MENKKLLKRTTTNNNVTLRHERNNEWSKNRVIKKEPMAKQRSGAYNATKYLHFQTFGGILFLFYENIREIPIFHWSSSG